MTTQRDRQKIIELARYNPVANKVTDLIDAELSADILNALTHSDTPSGTNPFATIKDITDAEFITSIDDTATVHLNIAAKKLTADFASLNISQFTNDSKYLSGSGSYTTQARNFATNYTPNTTNATLVIATFRLDCDDGEDSNVDILVGGNIIGNVRNEFNVTGVIGLTGSNITDFTVSFIVPPNIIYRFNNSGAGVETIQSVSELTL